MQGAQKIVVPLNRLLHCKQFSNLAILTLSLDSLWTLQNLYRFHSKHLSPGVGSLQAARPVAQLLIGLQGARSTGNLAQEHNAVP